MHTTPTARLVFIDNLRIMLTMLVVAHHAAQPYGPTGGEWPIFNPERVIDNAYMVYLIHLLLIIYLQFTMASLSIGPFAKFGLVTLMGIPISFAFSHLLRRLPWVRAIVF